MARLRVHNLSVSLDGFGAGPSQDRVNPLGVGGEALHEWQVPTRSFRQEHGDKARGTTGIDDDFVARAFEGIGAMHLAIAPVVLGTGEHLFAGIDLLKLGYELTEHVPAAAATHVVFTKR